MPRLAVLAAATRVAFTRSCMAERYQTEVVVTHEPTWTTWFNQGIWQYAQELIAPVDLSLCP